MSTGGAAPTAATRLTNNMILLQDFYVTACPTNGLANVQASCADQGPCCSKASVRFQFSEQREILLTTLRGLSFCSSGRGTIEAVSSTPSGHPPLARDRAQGQDAREARQQARRDGSCSGARHKGDRKDYRSRGAARRTSPAHTPAHQGLDRVSRGPRRSAE